MPVVQNTVFIEKEEGRGLSPHHRPCINSTGKAHIIMRGYIDIFFLKILQRYLIKTGGR